MSRDQLRSAIRELWALGINGPKPDKQKAVKKIIHAVEKEQRTMLNRIDVEELGDMDGLAENLETAEALAAGETPAGEAAGTQAAPTEKPKRLYIRKAGLATGEEKPKRGTTRRKTAPNDDGGGHPLALNGNGNGHTNGNGHIDGNQVALTPGQLSKLWAVITGGTLGIGIEADGGVTCWVSPESFNKALPVLIDRL